MGFAHQTESYTAYCVLRAPCFLPSRRLLAHRSASCVITIITHSRPAAPPPCQRVGIRLHAHARTKCTRSTADKLSTCTGTPGARFQSEGQEGVLRAINDGVRHLNALKYRRVCMVLPGMWLGVARAPSVNTKAQLILQQQQNNAEFGW